MKPCWNNEYLTPHNYHDNHHVFINCYTMNLPNDKHCINGAEVYSYSDQTARYSYV